VRVEAHRDRLLAVKRGELAWAELDAWRKELHHDFERAPLACHFLPSLGRMNCALSGVSWARRLGPASRWPGLLRSSRCRRWRTRISQTCSRSRAAHRARSVRAAVTPTIPRRGCGATCRAGRSPMSPRSARTWCTKEFVTHGLNPRLVQCSISTNKLKGTLRGMHYQAPPFEEAKLVRCTHGSVYDVIIDLRPASSTFMHHFGIYLEAGEHKAVYVPEGFAHGFLTLSDGAEVFYQISEFHASGSARGVRWNDPAFAIPWPGKVLVISANDKGYPNFVPSSKE